VRISLTDFVDFTIVNGSSRVAKVRALKKRGNYDPASDFWRTLREGIVELHRTAQMAPTTLDSLVATQAGTRRHARYADAADGYKKFLGRRSFPWFDPPPAQWWHEGELDVRVNPELGLVVDGNPTVIKLYFKNEAPTRSRVQAVLAVLDAELASRAARGSRFAVLDVNGSRLMVPDGRWSAGDMKALLVAEARAFVDIWNAI
jgi:hypothetical protein